MGRGFAERLKMRESWTCKGQLTGFDPKIQALDSSASYRWDQAGRAP